jgi:hypothetical protein
MSPGWLDMQRASSSVVSRCFDTTMHNDRESHRTRLKTHALTCRRTRSPAALHNILYGVCRCPFLLKRCRMYLLRQL